MCDGMTKKYVGMFSCTQCMLSFDFFKMFRFRESKRWQPKMEENLYCWLCRACTPAVICQQNTSRMNRLMRTGKCKGSGRANQSVISEGSCSLTTKVMLIDWACAERNLLINMIELVDMFLNVNRSSSFIHDFTFIEHPPTWAIEAAPQDVWVRSLRRMID
jgi:hypothetical protein